MADIVLCYQERNNYEYELMRNHNVFSDEKIRNIMKTRENLQYKLTMNTKCLKDYGNYIIHEKDLHALVVSIEDKRKDKFPALKAAISSRLIRVYKEALHEYPEESRLWNAFLKFCKNHAVSELSYAYEKHVQHQGSNPMVWCNAAMWFYEQAKNMEKTKTLFFRGLQRHPESEVLYSSFFNVLLTETANQPPASRQVSFDRVVSLYNNGAKNKICKIGLLIDLFEMCNNERFVGFTKTLKGTIVNDMMVMCAREEELWHFFAQQELKGTSIWDLVKAANTQPVLDDNDDTDVKDDKGTITLLKHTLRKRIEMCFTIYQTGAQTLKTPAMWSIFINAMIDLNTDLSTQQSLKRQKLAGALRGAHESKCLSEDHYYVYINLLIQTKANRELILSMMKEGTYRFGSVQLWEQRMTFHVMEDDEPRVYEVFRRATRQLGAESYPLWNLALQYYQTHYDDQYARLVEIFKDACTRTEPPFVAFRTQYLEWSIVNQPVHLTRRLYKELLKLPPPCLELYKRMALYEHVALKRDLEQSRECYENAVAAFGQYRADVWIDYIRFELSEGWKKNGTTLYERAQTALDRKYVDNFITEYCLLTVNRNNTLDEPFIDEKAIKINNPK